jgi:acyl-CoA reductase-like NAD-dependent aldehyde dehydrogenase
MADFFDGKVTIHGPDKLFIGGIWIGPSSEARIELVSPVTEQLVGAVAAADAADVDRAVAAARRAFDEGPWPGMTAVERGGFLARLAEALTARHEELSHAWTGQMGITFPFAQVATTSSIALAQFQADHAASYNWDEPRPTYYSGSVGRIVREPVGVVAAIAPWNAPLFSMIIKLAPALVAGCAVIMKPAPETPLEAYILAECVETTGFPPGVVNLVPAEREVSDYLIRHPGIDKVSFTGSSATGKRIAAVCADRIARVTLELGGKSAAILLPDMDLGEAASILAPSLTALSGQVCSNLTRYLVPRDRQSAFVDAMAARLEDIRVGDPYDAGIEMGPLAMARQLARVQAYVEKGVAEGARLVTGGHRPSQLNRGYFFEPTLFCDVDNRSTIAQEEIFGPVACVTAYDDLDDAVRLANDTPFGLAGAVLTHDQEAAYAVGRRIRAGTVSQNGLKPDFNIAFGGFKESGLGREGGVEAVLPYLETKTMILDAPEISRHQSSGA